MNKLIYFFIALSIPHTLPVARAAMLLHIDGVVTSSTHDDYLIEHGDSIYYIKRSALNKEQLKSLEKIGATVEIAVPPEAIDLVKGKKS